MSKRLSSKSVVLKKRNDHGIYDPRKSEPLDRPTGTIKALKDYILSHVLKATLVVIRGQLAGIVLNGVRYLDIQAYDETYGIVGRSYSSQGKHIGWSCADGTDYLDTRISDEINYRFNMVTSTMLSIALATLTLQGKRRIDYLERISGELAGAYIKYKNYMMSVSHLATDTWTEKENMVLPVEMEKRIRSFLQGETRPLIELCESLRDETNLIAIASKTAMIRTRGNRKPDPALDYLISEYDSIHQSKPDLSREQIYRQMSQQLGLFTESWAVELKREIDNHLIDYIEGIDQRRRKALSRRNV